MKNKKTIFLTGATGLVGSYLLKILLNEGYEVYALARSKDGKKVRDRVIEILKFWNEDIISGKEDFLFVLDGNITEKNLGLSKRNIDLLKDGICEIFHCAAITQFNWPVEKIREVNVEGTRKVLELAVECKEKGRLKKVNHVSTAYVCGDHKGNFTEDDLDVGQGFDSTYEQSKFEAEKLVEEYRKQGLWIDIFRPPLVLGESSTGKTTTFQQSVYQVLHIWNLEIFEQFPAKDYSFNAAFVDDICKAIFKISVSPSSPNNNYHIFDRETLSFEDLLDRSSKRLGFKKPELVSRDAFFKTGPSAAQKMLLANNILMFNNEVRLDSAVTVDALDKQGFTFSQFDEERLSRLLEFASRRIS